MEDSTRNATMYRRSYGHATKLEDIRRDAETTIDVRSTSDRPRGQIGTEVGLWELSTHHLA